MFSFFRLLSFFTEILIMLEKQFAVNFLLDQFYWTSLSLGLSATIQMNTSQRLFDFLLLWIKQDSSYRNQKNITIQRVQINRKSKNTWKKYSDTSASISRVLVSYQMYIYYTTKYTTKRELPTKILTKVQRDIN